jgi:hypothetical protein
MAEFFHGRRLRYQISLQREGRWQLVAVVDDERDGLGHAFGRADLDKLEAEVRTRARTALATPGATAVRVIRERIRADGYSQEEPFLSEAATAVKPVERQVTNYAGAIPVCLEFEDLLTRPALRTIGLVLRPWLDRQGMTPIELLTLKAVSSAVKRGENGVTAAIGLAARLQAEALGVPVRARIAEIESLAETCRTRVRAANLVAGPAKLAALGLDRFAAAIAERHRPEDRSFWALRGLAEFIAEPTSSMAKLERLLELNQPELGVPATDLLDDAAACLVDHSDVVGELLGHQADLRVALRRLAELAEGAAPPGAAASGAAAQLALLIAGGRLAKTRESFWDRLARSLAGQRPLTGGPIATELAAIAEVTSDLAPRIPASLQGSALAALERRQARVMQAMLDEMGQ